MDDRKTTDWPNGILSLRETQERNRRPLLCRWGIHSWRQTAVLDANIDGGRYLETCERCSKTQVVAGSY